MISISGCLYKRTFRGIVPWGTSAFSDLSALWMFSNICFFLIVARGNFYSHRTKRPRRFPEEIGESSGVFIYLNFLLTYRIRSLNKVGSQGYISHAVYLRSWTSTKMKHCLSGNQIFPFFFFIRKNYFWGSKCSHIHTRKVTHTSTAERNGFTPETIILPFVWALQVSARGGVGKRMALNGAIPGSICVVIQSTCAAHISGCWRTDGRQGSRCCCLMMNLRISELFSVITVICNDTVEARSLGSTAECVDVWPLNSISTHIINSLHVE